MKIPAINNNNHAVAHKAYFKPNKHFKNLAYGDAIKYKCLPELMQPFKKSLPNHELEILQINSSNIAKILNKTTHKTDEFITAPYPYGLIRLICSILGAKDSSFFKEDIDNSTDVIHYLTTKEEIKP